MTTASRTAVDNKILVSRIRLSLQRLAQFAQDGLELAPPDMLAKVSEDLAAVEDFCVNIISDELDLG